MRDFENGGKNTHSGKKEERGKGRVPERRRSTRWERIKMEING